MTIKQRNKTYHLRIRVPQRYRYLHRSSHVWRSLGTDSEELAARRAIEVREALFADWASGEIVSDSTSHADRFRRVADLAAAKGYAYQTSAELAAGPIEQLVRRIEVVGETGSRATMQALLGGVERPPVMLSELVSYVENLDDTKHENRFKNQAQMKRWRDERMRAVASLRAALKAKKLPYDKPVAELTSDDAWLHHEFLKKRSMLVRLISRRRITTSGTFLASSGASSQACGCPTRRSTRGCRSPTPTRRSAGSLSCRRRGSKT